MFNKTLIAVATATVLAGPAFAQDADIVDTAGAAGSFETLVAAVTAADLVDTLKGEGPFTVFAPTDDAFALLPEGTVPTLLENIPQLTGVLTYHVVPGRVMAADLTDGMTVETVQGDTITIGTTDGVTVNDVNVIQAVFRHAILTPEAG